MMMTWQSKVFDIVGKSAIHVPTGGGSACGFLFSSSSSIKIDTGFQGVVFNLQPSTIFFRRMGEGHGDAFVDDPTIEPQIRSCECYLSNTQDTKFTLQMEARYQMGEGATAFTPWSAYKWSSDRGWAYKAEYTEACLGEDARILTPGVSAPGKIEIRWQIPEFIDDSYVFGKDTNLIATLWKS